MNKTYWQRALLITFGGVLVTSCVSNKPDSEDVTVTRSLVTAKTFSHPTKRDMKKDMQACRDSVAHEELDKCMSEKGWRIKIKKYD